MITRNFSLKHISKLLFFLVIAGSILASLAVSSVSIVGAQEDLTATPIPPGTPATQNDALIQDLGHSSKPIASQFIIHFSRHASEKEKNAFVHARGGTVVQRIDALNIMVIRLPNHAQGQPNPKSPVVESIEQDYYIAALDDVIPNDPRYPEQWALPAIGAPSAWDQIPADAPEVTVAVIDSGICADHLDLAGRILDGWDFIENDTTPQDDFGHGCSVSGVIAANLNDGIGIAGVAPNAMIMPLRVLDAGGIGSYSDVAAAIVYAADNGAQVTNLSLGSSNPSSTLENAVNYAISKGVIIVAAAGNNGVEGALYPAAYPDVIAVGSVDPDLQYSSFSNYGPQIDIWAPGRDILTIQNDGTYGLVSGTSFAAPHVAGAEAVETALNRMLSLNGSILELGTQIDLSTSMATPSPLISPTESSTDSITATSAPPGFYSERSGEYSFNYPTDWMVVDDKYWENNDPLDFDSYVELKSPDKESITIRRWLNVEPLPINELAKDYLYFTLEDTAILYGNGFINLNPMTMAIEPGRENEKPTTISAIVRCRNSVYNFKYIGYNAGSNIRAYRDLLSSFNCTNGSDAFADSIPEISSSQFVKPPSILEGSAVTCEGFYDPTGNRYECGQCTWWASYSRPDIPDTSVRWPGDAYQWYNNAIQDPDFDVSPSPEGGAIAVWESNTGGTGPAGHVAYVTNVYANGHFDVTEMNWLCSDTEFPCPGRSRTNISDTDSINFILGGVTFFEDQEFGGLFYRARTNQEIFLNNWSSVFIPASWGVNLYKYISFGEPNFSRISETSVWALNSSLWNLQLDHYPDGSVINDNVRSARVINFSPDQCVNPTGVSNLGLSCGEPTPTPIPTQPTATLPPPSGGIQIVKVSSHLVKPGEQFDPSITIRLLSGSLVASRGDHLHAVPEDASNLFGAHFVQPVNNNVPTGGTYTFDVNNNSGFRMTAPTTPGQYQSIWQMRVGGVHIGPQAVINVTVKSDPITTPLPTPTIDCSNPPEGITLYEFTDYRGRCENFTADAMYLGNKYLGDNVASSIRVVGSWGVTLFRDPDWTGSWQEFSSNDNNLSDNQIGDNTVSSLRVWKPGDPCATLPQGVTLYRGRDFTGISQSFSRDAQFLGNEIIGDNTANSLRICGPYKVTLYRDPDWVGVSEDFTGSDANLTDNPINTTASSVRIVDVINACNSLPSGVTLYSETEFNGRSQTFSSDVQYLGNTGFGNDVAKSLRVCGHWKVTVFRDADWTGTWAEFTGETRELALTTIGTSASSIRMVDAYDFCKTLGPGVTLYRGRDFTGIAQTFTRDASFLGNERIGDNSVTSVRQCGYNSRLYRDPDWQGFSEEFSGREESNLTDNQIGVTSSSLRVWTVIIPPTPTLTPSPTPIPAKPDLVPYDANGSFPLIPSSVPGDHWVGTLYVGQITYLDWGIFNNSNVNVTTPFKVKLYLDGTQINEFSYTSLDANAYHGIDDWNIYVDTPGYHTLKIFVDSNTEIAETNETNNSWEGRFYWNSRPVTKYTLTISKAGTGTGTVTSDPTGINCGSDCSEEYAEDTEVTLTASSDPGSIFTGWSGDADCSDGQATMNMSKTCTAMFNIPPSANFVAGPVSGSAPLTVSFRIDETSNITSCSWDFGDGLTGTSCAELQDHTYVNAGTYTVSLTVNGPGGSDTVTINNYIYVLPLEYYPSAIIGNTGIGQFSYPTYIATDSLGNLYVVDRGNGRIEKFSALGDYLLQWGSYGTGNGQFNGFGGIEVDDAGYVFVSDWYNCRIQKFTSNGVFIAKWGSCGSGPGQFDGPGGIAIDRDGYVYVADDNNNRVQKFDPSGNFVLQWGSYGTGDGQFRYPRDVTIRQTDTVYVVYVVDWANSRIQLFDGSGGYIHQFGSYGTGFGQLNMPEAIDYGPDGYLYVAERGNCRIQKFTSGMGTPRTLWGGCGTNPGQFDYAPFGIAVDGAGYIYASDYDNDRVQKFWKVGSPEPCFSLTISLNNQSAGSVNATPAPNCSNGIQYKYGTVVTLSATANNGFMFENWSGGGCSGIGNCTVTMTTSNAITANFTLEQPQTFGDVSHTYWAWSFIERLYSAGITGGCGTSPLQYCPETTVTRSQMAVFLLRGIHGSAYSPPAVGVSTGFGDVPVDYWSAPWIKQLAAEGITGGCGNGNYCPEYPVTRDQMAVFLLRSKYGANYSPPAAGLSTDFGDVPVDHWAAPWIKQLVIEGITTGCGSGNYCPDLPVTRAQMAVFLVRTFNLP